MNKILIIDDSNLMLFTARDMLLKHVELTLDITLCHSGQEALALLEKESFDIILLDILMPGLTGMDVLKQLNENQHLPQIKVLMFSAVTDKKALRECFALGATDYITKPIEEDEFIARITSAINEQNLKISYRETIQLMQKQNEQLSHLYEQLANAERQMIQQEQMVGVGHLAAGIAHEINNPIGFIKSNLSSMNQYIRTLLGYIAHYQEQFGLLEPTVLQGDLSLSYIQEDAQLVYAEIREGIARIEAIVNSLRSFSAIDSTTGYVELDLPKTMDDILLLLSNEIGKQIQIEKDYGLVEQIIVNNSEVHLALLNIIQNAIYAVKHDAKVQKCIRLTVTSDDEHVIAKVWDNGVGIQPDKLAAVYNPFYTTKAVGEGTGLGLSMAYDIIVNKHQGHIAAESVFGEWTEFTVALPKALY